MKYLCAGLLLILSLGVVSIAWADTTTAADEQTDGRHDFDFYIGSWNIANRTRTSLDSNEWREFQTTAVDRSFLGGMGNMDEILLPKGRVGASLRFFDAEKKQWSIYWATDRTGLEPPPVVGHFENGVGTFYADDVDAAGKPVKQRFTWSNITKKSAHWDQAISSDGGKTWAMNWIMEFTRVQ